MNGLVLINGRGDEYNLFDENKSPAFAVEGLGYEDETDFLRIGSTYHALSEISAQRSISLTLPFYREADRRYRAFVDFARRDPLTLLYTNDAGQYYIPCRLRTIEKPDQPRYKQYICPVSFVLTGNPYEILSAECKADTTVEGKVYPYSYDYVYSNDLTNSLIIRSGSYVNGACVLTIYGGADTPVWRHYHNGNLVETGAYSGAIPDGHKLVIDSRSIPHSIVESDANDVIVADRYQLCDFSTERFMHVGEGENRYVLSHNGVTDLTARMEAYVEYETI